MSAESSAVTFLLPDPARVLTGVRLIQDARIPGDRLDFSFSGDHWELAIDQPPLDRMEYQFELFLTDGTRQWVLDPGNPETVDGAFGKKSVREFDLPAPQLDAIIPVRVWSPPGAPEDEPLPLLIANDGPEYDSLASLTRYLAGGVTGTWLPRMRAALLSPGARDRWYSANLGYARALRHVVIPALTSRLATKARIGMGTSLGALAMLHAHCRFPDAFDAMFLESGSFFLPRFDGHERRFPYYRRIVSFVSGVHRGRLPGRPIPVVLTCGVIEENVEINRLMTQTLLSAGYPASLHEVPDMHNYTAWRDAFDPYLTQLLWQVAQ